MRAKTTSDFFAGSKSAGGTRMGLDAMIIQTARTSVSLRRGSVAFVCAIIAVSLAHAALAQSEDCVAPSPTAIAVEPLPLVEVETDGGKSTADLRVLAERSSDGRRVGLTLGHYQARARYQYTINADGRGLSGGGVCVVVKGLTVGFGFSRRVTYIAREVHDFPCVRAAVVAHEDRHVTADDTVLRLYLTYLKAALELEYGTGLVVKASTPDESRRALKTILDGRLGQAVEEFDFRRQQAQREIDERDEEAAIVAACGPEAQSFLRRYR